MDALEREILSSSVFLFRLKSGFRTTQTGFRLGNAHSGKWDDCRCDPPTSRVAAHCGHMSMAKIGICRAFEGLLLMGEVSDAFSRLCPCSRSIIIRHDSERSLSCCAARDNYIILAAEPPCTLAMKKQFGEVGGSSGVDLRSGFSLRAARAVEVVSQFSTEFPRLLQVNFRSTGK